jgi:hypothetical protein
MIERGGDAQPLLSLHLDVTAGGAADDVALAFLRHTARCALREAPSVGVEDVDYFKLPSASFGAFS